MFTQNRGYTRREADWDARNKKKEAKYVPPEKRSYRNENDAPPQKSFHNSQFDDIEREERARAHELYQQDEAERKKKTPIQPPKSAVSKLRDAIPRLQSLDSVSTITGNEIGKNGSVVDRLMNFIDRVGNSVMRKGFGEVLFTRRGIKNSMLGHGIGNAKIDAFAAVPDVIKSGIEIEHQKKWKGRDYDTYIFAAPITYGGERTYLGVVVNQDRNSNRYYVHEVIDENGNLIYNEEAAPSIASDTPLRNISGDIVANEGTASGKSIATSPENVNAGQAENPSADVKTGVTADSGVTGSVEGRATASTASDERAASTQSGLVADEEAASNNSILDSESSVNSEAAASPAPDRPTGNNSPRDTVASEGTAPNNRIAEVPKIVNGAEENSSTSERANSEADTDTQGRNESFDALIKQENKRERAAEGTAAAREHGESVDYSIAEEKRRLEQSRAQARKRVNLQRNNMTQKTFMIGLIQEELERDRTLRESAAESPDEGFRAPDESSPDTGEEADVSHYHFVKRLCSETAGKVAVKSLQKSKRITTPSRERFNIQFLIRNHFHTVVNHAIKIASIKFGQRRRSALTSCLTLFKEEVRPQGAPCPSKTEERCSKINLSPPQKMHR